MCGIAGILSLNTQPASLPKVKQMCNLMKHRGPDDEGFYQDGKKKIVLGHRRLSIIDLSKRGKQPMSNSDKSLWIVYNGEIYNYKELRESLKGKYKFKSNSDTEVLLHLYAEKGPRMLDDLIGMFAFAIYDLKKKQLFMARDRIGQKPLLYSFEDSKFYFASELRPILNALETKPKINKSAVNYCFLHNFEHVPEPLSIFEGIHKLPPASYAIVKGGNIEIKKYWIPSFKKDNKSEKEFLDEYSSLLESASNLRMVSDVEVGLTLSGGVDSSSILSVLSNRKNLKTFAIGFDKNDEELKRARKVSKIFGTKHKEFIFEKNFIKYIPELISIYGEPLTKFTILHSYALSKGISKELKVVLGGNGADEIFYGYDSSNRLLRVSNFLKTFSGTKHIFGLLKVLSGSMGLNKFELLFTMLSADPKKIKGDVYRLMSKRNMVLYSPKMRSHLENKNFGKLVDQYTNESNSPDYIERSYYSGLMLEDAHSITIMGDLTGMACSLEIRAPFLDHRMVEFGARLPINMKIRDIFNIKSNKYIMRKFLETKLPKDIVYAKKMGLGYYSKTGKILRTLWKEDLEQILFNKSLAKSGFFDMDYVRKAFDEHMSKKKDRGKLLYGLMVFEIWYEIFIEGKKPEDIKFISS